MKVKRQHYDYFLALEADLVRLTRYIEFNKQNFKAYSIEIMHLLFAVSSEVEVMLKQFSHSPRQ
jgi:hypothetical protein